MEDNGMAIFEQVASTSKGRSSKKKRRWREIEAIQDRKRLIAELKDLGLSDEDELAQLQF